MQALRLLSKGGDPIPLLEAVLLYYVAPKSLQSSQVVALESIPTLLGVDIERGGTTLVGNDLTRVGPSGCARFRVYSRRRFLNGNSNGSAS